MQNAKIGPADFDRVALQWDKFTLPNGLTVIVHENRAVPLVTVNVWYKVGAKDEKPGKTGLAHLFEHLMFGGSANMPGSYLDNMGQIGAMDMNGTTNADRTNFYQTVQTGALDVALFAESDRMGHFLETLGSAVLERQRGVVLNEKEQTEGQPYGKVTETVARGLFPPDHPYAHTTLGWREDVEGVTLEDARDWFRSYYSPSNAVLSLAGDIDLETARAKAIEFFGDIPPGPPVKRPVRWVPAHRGTRRETAEDEVPFPRLIMSWHIPPAGDRDATCLSMAVQMLGGGTASRLHRRLVEQDRLATGVNVGFAAAMLSGQIVIETTLPPGGNLDTAEAAIREELDRFRSEGPNDDEVFRVKVRAEAGLIRQLQTGQAVADLLAMNEVFFGNPGRYEEEMRDLALIEGQEIQSATARWLGDADYVLHVVPRAVLSAASGGFHRPSGPQIDPPTGIHLPPIAEARLTNGIRVLVATRADLPMVEARMVFPRGEAIAPRDRMGIASFMAGLMSESAGDRDVDALREVMEREAVGLGARVGSEFSGAGISTLRSRLDLALEVMADIARRPRFEDAEIERVRRMLIAGLHGVAAAPTAAAHHVLPALMFGEGHPHARLSQGLPNTLAAINRDDLLALHARIFDPAGAAIIAVGDVTIDELLPKLEERFGDWQSKVSAARQPLPASRPAKPGIYLIDRPGATQSALIAALMIPSHRDIDPLALTVIDTVLGGAFGSRLNMNLRENKSWTYGIRSEIGGTLDERVYSASGLVQADRTADAMIEIAREYRDLVGNRPISEADLALIVQGCIMGLPSRIQTLGALASSIEALVQLGRPLDHWSTYADRIRALDADTVNALAQDIIRPERLVWIVAGDRLRIERDIAQAELGNVTILATEDDARYR